MHKLWYEVLTLPVFTVPQYPRCVEWWLAFGKCPLVYMESNSQVRKCNLFLACQSASHQGAVIQTGVTCLLQSWYAVGKGVVAVILLYQQACLLPFSPAGAHGKVSSERDPVITDPAAHSQLQLSLCGDFSRRRGCPAHDAAAAGAGRPTQKLVHHSVPFCGI